MSKMVIVDEEKLHIQLMTLTSKIEALTDLMEDTYFEGYNDGHADGVVSGHPTSKWVKDAGECWWGSDSKETLTEMLNEE